MYNHFSVSITYMSGLGILLPPICSHAPPCSPPASPREGQHPLRDLRTLGIVKNISDGSPFAFFSLNKKLLLTYLTICLNFHINHSKSRIYPHTSGPRPNYQFIIGVASRWEMKTNMSRCEAQGNNISTCEAYRSLYKKTEHGENIISDLTRRSLQTKHF